MSIQTLAEKWKEEIKHEIGKEFVNSGKDLNHETKN